MGTGSLFVGMLNAVVAQQLGESAVGAQQTVVQTAGHIDLREIDTLFCQHGNQRRGVAVICDGDFQILADLNEGAYLTEAPENVWPFVVNAGLLDSRGDEADVIGNARVTFYVEFNRNMDTALPLDVRFGSFYPYAD